MPRTAWPPICPVRSSGQAADPGALPTAAEQARYWMVIGIVPDLVHNDMWHGATSARKQAMVGWLRRCLRIT